MWLLADAPKEKQSAFRNYIMELSPSALDAKHDRQKTLKDRRQKNARIGRKGKLEGRGCAPTQVNFDPFPVASAKVFKFGRGPRASALEDLSGLDFSVAGSNSNAISVEEEHFVQREAPQSLDLPEGVLIDLTGQDRLMDNGEIVLNSTFLDRMLLLDTYGANPTEVNDSFVSSKDNSGAETEETEYQEMDTDPGSETDHESEDASDKIRIKPAAYFDAHMHLDRLARNLRVGRPYDLNSVLDYCQSYEDGGKGRQPLFDLAGVVEFLSNFLS